MNYYKRLKDCREDSDLIQQQIADYLGISRGNYAMYECGSNIIPLQLLDKLALKYNVSIDYLVSYSNTNSILNNKKMDLNLLCERIRQERLKSNLSQEQVAKILEITQSHYATYENHHNIIPITRLIKLADLYNVSIDYLMGKVN